MPLYVYECPECSRRIEVIKSLERRDYSELCADFCHVGRVEEMQRVEYPGSSFVIDKSEYV
jgi:predicted nucleic acid-binding Zn ribbon protein